MGNHRHRQDMRHGGLRFEAEPTVFLPNLQVPHILQALVVRTSVDPVSLATAVKQQIQSVDKDQGVGEIRSMELVVANSIARPRLQTVLLGIFAAIALTLACVGIYGVISYSVEQRAREIGIRIAVGAEPWSIFRLVLREGLTVTGSGLVVGLAAAFALTRYLETLLYGVKPTDPAVFAAVAALLLVVSAAACYIPARRATRLDPIAVLRDE